MKSLIPVLALIAPLAHALPEFDTDLVGHCRRGVEAELSAAIRDACVGPTFVKAVTDIDENVYTVEFTRPACRAGGEAEITLGPREQLQRDGRTLVGRCLIQQVKINDHWND